MDVLARLGWRLSQGAANALVLCSELCALRHQRFSLGCLAQMLLRSPASRRASGRSRGRRSDRRLLTTGTRNWQIKSGRSCNKCCIAAALSAHWRMVSCLTRLPIAVFYR